jgi:pantetheine-phosphate adenylyltransferase
MRLLFPGSFDPPHLGHWDIAARAATLLAPGDELVVAVADHPDKPGWLPVVQRLDLLDRGLDGIAHDGARVAAYHGATVAYARSIGATALVRGLRQAADLEAERPMAEIHRREGLETLFLITDARWSFLSSSVVRRTAAAGLSVAGLVDDAVLAVITARQATAP